LKHGRQIAAWGRSLSDIGDILIYACNLATSEEGKAFIVALADLTDSDVAASTDITGGKSSDGNWKLEYATGRIGSVGITLDPELNVKLATRIWEGFSSSEWTLSANWFNSDLPVDGDDIVIQDLGYNNPIFTGTAFYNTLTINASATLTVSSGTFSVSGSSDIIGKLNIAAGTFDANGNFDATGGEVTFTGAGILELGSTVTNLGTFTKSTGTVTYDGGDQDVAAVDYYGIAFGGTGTKTAASSLTATTLSAAASAYSVALNGGCTINNSCTFLNTGTTTIGNDAGDSSTFRDGLIATSGPVSIAGTITVSNGDREMRLGPTDSLLGNVTVNDDSTLAPPVAEVSGTILIHLGAVTINAAKTLTVGNDNGQATSFDSTINSASGGTGNLTINNSATFSNDVGGTTAIGVLTLTAGTVSAGANNITAGTIAVNRGTLGRAASPSGIWDVKNVTIASGATLNATSGINSEFNVSGNWANSGAFNHKNGTVTLDGTNQIISGTTTFYNLTKNVTSAATLTFPSAITTTVENTLNVSGASGQLLSLRSSSLGTQWGIDPQGTRNIAYLDVQDSNNVSGTVINTVDKNIVDSGRNTGWDIPPTVTTQAVSGIGTTSATGNGTIISLGSTNPTAHGVCWNTLGTPIISDDVKDNGVASAAGSFTASMTGLSPGTTYHVRAFATNTVETSYGTEFTFTTGNTVPAGTYYVNISRGDDTNNGSVDLPWKTLHHAISQINGGPAGTYVLHVALGTYDVSGSTREADEEMVLSQSYVTIIGENGSAPVINGTNAQNWTKGIEITGSNVIVENIYVTGFTDAGEEGIRISGGTGNEIRYCSLYGNNWGMRVNEASGTVIKNCDIYDNSTHGIDIVQSTETSVVGNKIHGNPRYGIRAESSPKISRNEIYDNQYGIFLDGVNGNTVSPVIKNNVIYEVVSNAMSYGIFALSNNESIVNPNIYHNTIDGGKLIGIAVEKDAASSSAPIIKYNIISEFGQYGIQNIGASPTINYNDVWNNATSNYEGCQKGTNDINEDPLYGNYSLQAESPCIDGIPSTEGDPVTLDYPGFNRPRPNKETKSMGAYEYVPDVTVNYTMPGGTGAATDYRIFTIPLSLGTGAEMLTVMESVLGTYDPVHWRAFLYNGTSYNEFNSSQFGAHTIKPGMGFWIITTYADVIPFKGQPAPDGVDYVMDLQPGWYLIGLPWVDTNIFLSSIKVTDGVYTYALSDAGNNFTQRFLWDYTGVNGYAKRTAAGFRLQNNKGYFFKVLSSVPIRMIIPNAANLAQNALVDMPSNQTNTYEDDEAPPPPPGAEPIPDIKANGQDGPVAVNAGDSVAVSVSLDPGIWNGQNADWWVAAHTPFASPWYTYAYPGGWKSGIQACVQMPLFELLEPLNVLNMVLPVGSYTFYFAVDGNMNGAPDVTWMDSVQVNVE
jgi:parallel beta-helix repeat protein